MRVATRASDSALVKLTLDFHGFCADVLCPSGHTQTRAPEDTAAGPGVATDDALVRAVHGRGTGAHSGTFSVHMTPAGPRGDEVHTAVHVSDMCWSAMIFAHVYASVSAEKAGTQESAAAQSADGDAANEAHGTSDSTGSPVQHGLEQVEQHSDPFTVTTLTLTRCALLAAAAHLPQLDSTAVPPAAFATAPGPAVRQPPQPPPFGVVHGRSSVASSSATAADHNTANAQAGAHQTDDSPPRDCAVELAVESAHLVIPDASIADVLRRPDVLQRVLTDAFAPSEDAPPRVLLHREATGVPISTSLAQQGNTLGAVHHNRAPHLHLVKQFYATVR